VRSPPVTIDAAVDVASLTCSSTFSIAASLISGPTL
jgi:hypothetical protein